MSNLVLTNYPRFITISTHFNPQGDRDSAIAAVITDIEAWAWSHAVREYGVDLESGVVTWRDIEQFRQGNSPLPLVLISARYEKKKTLPYRREN